MPLKATELITSPDATEATEATEEQSNTMEKTIMFVTQDRTNVRADAAEICGTEPLPEPYESAARMVYGDRVHNEAFIANADFQAGSLHRWRQHPEMIARVRFLSRSHRRHVQVSREWEALQIF